MMKAPALWCLLKAMAKQTLQRRCSLIQSYRTIPSWSLQQASQLIITAVNYVRAVVCQDIPAPRSSTVASYEREQKPDYQLPVAYIRFPKKTTTEEDYQSREYSLLHEDEQWLNTHAKYGERGSVSSLLLTQIKGGAQSTEEVVNVG